LCLALSLPGVAVREVNEACGIRSGRSGVACGANGAGFADELDIPDAEDMASPGQTEITGMDLIQRELGGKIIGEIED